jgi:hypothetical protein
MGSSGEVGALVETVSGALASGAAPDPATLRALVGTTDVLALGALADDLRRARHGQIATFLRVHELDIATLQAWTAAPEAAGEVRLYGQPASLADAVAAVERARVLAGERILRGFWLADLTALGPGAVAALRTAGLDEIAFVTPGQGVAAAVAGARAAGLAVRVIAVEQATDDRLTWLLDARRLAQAAGGITAVAPLPRRIDRAAPTTGFDDVRTVSLARLLIGDVPSVQVDWVRYGPKLAQVALGLGADDLDGVTSIDDPALGVRRAAAEDVRRNIVSAGFAPVERDGRWITIGQ